MHTTSRPSPLLEHTALSAFYMPMSFHLETKQHGEKAAHRGLSPAQSQGSTLWKHPSGLQFKCLQEIR